MVQERAGRWCHGGSTVVQERARWCTRSVVAGPVPCLVYTTLHHPGYTCSILPPLVPVPLHRATAVYRKDSLGSRRLSGSGQGSLAGKGGPELSRFLEDSCREAWVRIGWNRVKIGRTPGKTAICRPRAGLLRKCSPGPIPPCSSRARSESLTFLTILDQPGPRQA